MGISLRPLFLRTSGSSGVLKLLRLKGIDNYPVTQKKKKKKLSTWIPVLARPELNFGLTPAKARSEGDRLVPRESGCRAAGLGSATCVGLPAALSVGGQAAVPSPIPPLTNVWDPTAALVNKVQQLTELVAVLDPSKV
ncbi:TPA: hypothetical protein ACH3X1_009680 [Trebouxia sp. C0004]